MPDAWTRALADAVRWLRAEHAAHGAATPLVVAFAGPEPLLAGVPRPSEVLRPPLLELAALALPLGADRLLVAGPGRMRTRPVVPRSTAATRASARTGRGVTRDVLVAVGVDASGVRDPTHGGGGGAHAATLVELLEDATEVPAAVRPDDVDGALAGPLAAWLVRLLELGPRLTRTSDRDLADQLTRCLARGHRIALSEAAAARLRPVTSGGG